LTINLTRAIRKSLRAEDEASSKRRRESAAFRHALSFQPCGREDAKQQAANALAVARAVIETARAERQLARCLVREAELHLCQARSVARALDGSFGFALKQLHNVLDAARLSGLHLDSPTLDIAPTTYTRSASRGSNAGTSDPSEGPSTDEESINDGTDSYQGQVADDPLDGRSGGSESDIGDAHHYVHLLQAGEQDDMQQWRSIVSGDRLRFLGSDV
jgi:hypothetical protein